jgi:uncharacterized protein YaiI (UPF0178 family)
VEAKFANVSTKPLMKAGVETLVDKEIINMCKLNDLILSADV